MDFSIDYKQLRRICVASEKELYERYRAQRVMTTGGKPYFYFDNGASVLAVAHLDTVRNDTHFWPVRTRSYDLVYNACLDDRLGVYLLMHKLPELLGKNAFDVLLTTDEEILQSTGFWFEPPAHKHYNWLFQFDRRDDDVVMYDYETRELRKLLAEHGFKTGIGTYSDIVEMESLGVSGFNFGCAYFNAHAELCYVDIHKLQRQLKKFVGFYRALHSVTLAHVPVPHTTANKYYTPVNYRDYFGKNEECIGCGVYADLNKHKLCRSCAADDVDHTCEYCTSDGASYYPVWRVYLCAICAKQFIGE